MMFIYLSPTGILAAACVASWFIDAAYPNGDSRNIGGACCMVVMGPAALILAYPVIKEATLRGGKRVLLQALAFWAAVPVVCWLILLILVKFDLLKRGF